MRRRSGLRPRTLALAGLVACVVGGVASCGGRRGGDTAATRGENSDTADARGETAIARPAEPQEDDAGDALVPSRVAANPTAYIGKHVRLRASVSRAVAGQAFAAVDPGQAVERPWGSGPAGSSTDASGATTRTTGSSSSGSSSGPGNAGGETDGAGSSTATTTGSGMSDGSPTGDARWAENDAHAVLVLSPAQPSPGTTVTVSGAVRTFTDVSDFREQAEWLHSTSGLEAYRNRPVIVADSVRTAEGRELVPGPGALPAGSGERR